MDNLQEMSSKEIQDIELKPEEMHNTITERKNSLEAASSRTQEAEERISEVEDRLVGITDVEQKREKRLKTNEESLRELWDNVKCTNIHIMGCQKKRERREKKIFQEIIAKNFPNMGKESLTQIQEAQQVPYKINPRRNTPRYILIKLTKIKDKEKKFFLSFCYFLGCSHGIWSSQARGRIGAVATSLCQSHSNVGS